MGSGGGSRASRLVPTRMGGPNGADEGRGVCVGGEGLRLAPTLVPEPGALPTGNTARARRLRVADSEGDLVPSAVTPEPGGPAARVGAPTQPRVNGRVARPCAWPRGARERVRGSELRRRLVWRLMSTGGPAHGAACGCPGDLLVALGSIYEAARERKRARGERAGGMGAAGTTCRMTARRRTTGSRETGRMAAPRAPQRAKGEARSDEKGLLE